MRVIARTDLPMASEGGGVESGPTGPARTTSPGYVCLLERTSCRAWQAYRVTYAPAPTGVA